MSIHYCSVFPDSSGGRIYPTLISILIQINGQFVLISQFLSTLPTLPPCTFFNLKELWSVFFFYWLRTTFAFFPRWLTISPSPHTKPAPTAFMDPRGYEIESPSFSFVPPQSHQVKICKGLVQPLRHRPALTCACQPGNSPAPTLLKVSSQAPTNITAFAPSVWGLGLDEPISWA